jgi:signal transduction histidine kinase
VNARILLVDDDTALLEALPRALKLRMDGIHIDTSENAADALARIKETEYDAIVSDIKMPGMDGLALLREVRELRPKTPTLLITGHGEHDLAVQALRGGAYDFVQKPIDRDYFVASLERAIHMRRLDRQVEEQRLALERHVRVLEHVDDGVFLVDDDGIVQYWNPAAEAITGLATDEVLGRPAAEVLPGWDAISALVPVAPIPGPGSREAKTLPIELEGRELWLSTSAVKFADGIVYAFRSLTEERALEDLKGEFVATVSHELRTPLAAIYGSAKTLLRPDLELDDVSRTSLLEVIAQESERLSRIAGDILLANNLDSARLKLAQEEVDLAVLAAEVVDEMRQVHADRNDISIELTLGDSLAPVAGDADKLRQVLINLIDNAVKYSPNGGCVEVAIEPRDQGVRIAVRDEGIGIPLTEQQRIFGKFYRVDPELSRGVGGTGLGLYICRELVRRMDGRVSVQSREGEGAMFVVDLPVAAVQVRTVRPTVAETASP